MASFNTVVLLALMLLLVVSPMTSVVAGQKLFEVLNVKCVEQVLCGTNGNLLAGGGASNIFAGAANANVSLGCGSDIIASAVTDANGIATLAANVRTSNDSDAPYDYLQQMLGLQCWIEVERPVPGCPALSGKGAMVATAGVTTIVPIQNGYNVTLADNRPVVGASVDGA